MIPRDEARASEVSKLVDIAQSGSEDIHSVAERIYEAGWREQAEPGFTPLIAHGKKFVWDGEPSRPPMKGEWFYIGDLPGHETVLQAPEDYRCAYFIMVPCSPCNPPLQEPEQ